MLGSGDEPLASSGENDPLCPTDRMAENRLETDQAERFTTYVPDHLVAEATSLELGSLFDVDSDIAVHSLPGHTAGSVVVTAGATAFVGDLFRGSITGRAAVTHFYMCDLDDNTDDIAALLEDIAPDATRFFAGHFGPLDRSAVTTLLEERRAE